MNYYEAVIRSRRRRKVVALCYLSVIVIIGFLLLGGAFRGFSLFSDTPKPEEILQISQCKRDVSAPKHTVCLLFTNKSDSFLELEWNDEIVLHLKNAQNQSLPLKISQNEPIVLPPNTCAPYVFYIDQPFDENETLTISCTPNKVKLGEKDYNQEFNYESPLLTVGQNPQD